MKFDTSNHKYLSDNWLGSDGYKTISANYRELTAKRSGVKLINHINEGLKVLSFIDADYWTAYAYCLHPLVQDSIRFKNLFLSYCEHPTRPTVFAVEYRYAANSFLCPHKKEDYKPSIFPEVKQMLIADKIQNRKDFEIYHKETHPNSARLAEYFAEWMDILDIREEDYQAIKDYLIANI